MRQAKRCRACRRKIGCNRNVSWRGTLIICKDSLGEPKDKGEKRSIKDIFVRGKAKPINNIIYMADIETPKSKRDQMAARLKSKYPDKEYGDDEAIFGQIYDDYDEYDQKSGELEKYKEREGKLTDMFTRDPRSAEFITDMATGKDPWVSLINRIGIDGVKEMLEDPERVEEFAASNKEYVERIARNKELEATWEKNMEATLKMLEGKQKEYGLSDEEVDEAADWIRDITNDAVLGIIKPETFDMAMKAIKHDTDVAESRTQGEIAGRNSKMEAQLRKPKAGDGLPQLRGANNATEDYHRGMSIFDEARAAK